MEIKTVLTTVIAGSHYLVHPQVLGTIQETIKPDVILPVTVLEPEQLYDHLEGTLRLFDFYDDVFTPEFGSILIEKPGGSSGVAISSLGNGKSVMHLSDTAATKRSVSGLPAGPYILHGPNLHQAWKIYNDTLDAFAFGVYPEKVDQVDGFRVLQLPHGETNYTSIPVPSKLYNTVPPEKAPLRGYRFTVPDSMSLKGIPTTFSSNAWRELHNNTAETTAEFAKRLVELGATIVGKTKSSQFGSGREWTDETCPKNPRGDGHQDPAGGATGAASSVAGYEWLRASTGLDAIGQVFGPAVAQGLFALRTSPGLVPLDDPQIPSTKFDSLGIFSRDLSQLFRDAVAVVHKSLASPPISFPKHIFFVTDLAGSNVKNNDRHEEFLAAVQAFLGVKARRVSLTEVWASKPPPEAKGQGLQEYMEDAPFLSFCHDFYHQYDQFRSDYQAKFGSEPAVEPTVQYRWDLGKNVTQQQYDEHQFRLTIFQKWFDKSVMPTHDHGDAILVLPKPHKLRGITPDSLAPILQTPQILAPFAQIEYQPVCGAIIGPRGSDTMLVKLVEATLQQAQWRTWRTSVDTGRFAFPPAQNARDEQATLLGSLEPLEEL